MATQDKPWPTDWWISGKWVITPEAHAVLRRLVPFVSRDVTRPHLQTIVVVDRFAYATDGHRAARILLDQAPPAPVRIPVDLVKAIKPGGVIEWWDDGTVRAEGIVQKVEGKPPPFEQVMRGGGSKEFVGDRDTILKAVRKWIKAAKGAGYSGKIATLTSENGGLEISTKASALRENWTRVWLRENEETTPFSSTALRWYGQHQVKVLPDRVGRGWLLVESPDDGKFVIKSKEEVLLKHAPPVPVQLDLPALGLGEGRWGVDGGYLEDAIVAAPKGSLKIVLGGCLEVIRIEALGYLAVVMPRS